MFNSLKQLHPFTAPSALGGSNRPHSCQRWLSCILSFKQPTGWVGRRARWGLIFIAILFMIESLRIRLHFPQLLGAPLAQGVGAAHFLPSLRAVVQLCQLVTVMPSTTHRWSGTEARQTLNREGTLPSITRQDEGYLPF